MPEEIIDPGLLEQTKNQIRKLVAEIADLAESDIQPNEFYVEFLNRSVAAVAATGGAFWMMDGRGGLQAAIPGRVRRDRPDGRPGQDRARTTRCLGCMLQASQAADHPSRRGDRGGSAGIQPDRVRADHRPAHGGQAGGRPARDPDGPDPAGRPAEEHAAVCQRPVRPGGDLSQEPPDAADDVAAAALEPARGVHAPDPRLAGPEGDRLRRGQRRQAAGRLRPAHASR